MSLDLVKKYWDEANELTTDLQPDNQFSTPELVTYLNDHLPSPHEDVTKTKVNYLRDQGILKPKEYGGEIRTSWRYTADDARRVLAVELLKTRASLSIKEIKGWLLSFFEDNRRSEFLDGHLPRTNTQELQTSPPPTSVNSAYALLRNRALGTLITALGSGEAEMTPPECLIGIRIVDQAGEAYLNKLTWDQARTLLEKEAWTLAVSDAYFKLYVYTDFVKLQKNRPAVATMLPQNNWYFLTLQDPIGQLYQVVLGLPESNIQHPSILAIEESLEQRINNDEPIQLGGFPGLSTLLRAAFINQLNITRGTTLAVLVEIIAAASERWDYCSVLVPEPSEDGNEKWLRVLESSSKFPPRLKSKLVEIGKPLSGWCYRYHQEVFVEPTADNDPRITFYEEEEHPTAAAAIPAIAEDQRVVGVIYIAGHARTGENPLVFTDEMRAGLKAFGYICGDMIARDQIEIETVRSVSRVSTRPLYPLSTSSTNLEDLLQSIADEVKKGVGVSLVKVAVSWIYLLTLNIQNTSKDTISQWLRQQGIDLTGNFLANHLWDPPHRDPLPIGRCKLGDDQYVFAILQAVDLSEDQYKKRITYLQQEMKLMRIGGLSPDFYPSAITFRYEDLRQQLENDGLPAMVADLKKRTLERLTAGPYFKRGHEALSTNDLDHAVSEFEDALRYVPNSWYGYKHLAEARMLQGTSSSIEEAVEKCQKAIELNPYYASAHCLLADCYSYDGRFGDALIEYEKTLHLDSTRHDFLTRYGLALASMSPSEYQNALQYLRREQPDLARQRTYLNQPWLEAIDKFDRVRKLRTSNDTPDEQRARRANYYYYRGYAYLQAGLIDKAVEEFAVGRKLAPDNLQLIQAYSYALSLRRREEEKTKQ